MIPALRFDGQLPVGVHAADDWAEVERVFGGTARRRELLLMLRQGLENLRDAGCPWVLLDGSFTTGKPEPNDVDGCWEWVPAVDLARIDPAFVRLSAADRAHLKTKYGMDFFIADMIEGGSGEPFASFFQQDRAGNPRGIVRLELSTL
ncbi:MAG TPA: hypothetical protein VF627_13030 [Abditibacterium sp.]|jgi:hypothetical protein